MYRLWCRGTASADASLGSLGGNVSATSGTYIQLRIKFLPTADDQQLWRTGSSQNRMRMRRSDMSMRMEFGTTNIVQTAPNSVVFDEWLIIRLESFGSVKRLTVTREDGSAVMAELDFDPAAPQATTTMTNFGWQAFSTANFLVDYVDNGTGRIWDTSKSNGTGSILTARSGHTHSMTGTSYTNPDNSHWVYYDGNGYVGLGWDPTVRTHDTLSEFILDREFTTRPEVAVCSGDLGTTDGLLSSSAFAGGLTVTSDVEYTGNNHTELPFFRGALYLTNIAVIKIEHIAFLAELGSSPALRLIRANSSVKNCYFKRVAGGNTALLDVSLATASNLVIDGNNLVGIPSINAISAIVDKCIVFGATTRGHRTPGSADAGSSSNVFSFNNGTTDYFWTSTDSGAVVSTKAINCASEKTGAYAGTHTGYTSAELVDFANGDYRIKTTSNLHDLGIGAFFEESGGANEQVFESNGTVTAVITTVSTNLSVDEQPVNQVELSGGILNAVQIYASSNTVTNNQMLSSSGLTSTVTTPTTTNNQVNAQTLNSLGITTAVLNLSSSNEFINAAEQAYSSSGIVTTVNASFSANQAVNTQALSSSGILAAIQTSQSSNTTVAEQIRPSSGLTNAVITLTSSNEFVNNTALEEIYSSSGIVTTVNNSASANQAVNGQSLSASGVAQAISSSASANQAVNGQIRSASGSIVSIQTINGSNATVNSQIRSASGSIVSIQTGVSSNEYFENNESTNSIDSNVNLISGLSYTKTATNAFSTGSSSLSSITSSKLIQSNANSGSISESHLVVVKGGKVGGLDSQYNIDISAVYGKSYQIENQSAHESWQTQEISKTASLNRNTVLGSSIFYVTNKGSYSESLYSDNDLISNLFYVANRKEYGLNVIHTSIDQSILILSDPNNKPTPVNIIYNL
jgi:hypothetical protein